MIHKELQDINPYVRICVCTKTYPGWSLVNRIIYDHQLVLTSSGRGTVTIGRRSYNASRGDLFLIKPGLVHGFEPDDEAPFEMLVVHFDFFYERDRNFWPHKKFHLSGGETKEDMPEKHLLRDIPVFEKNMVFPDYMRLRNYTAVEVLMRKLIDLYAANVPGKELSLKSYFLEVLYLIYSEIIGGKTGGNIANGFEKIKNAFDFINKRYMDKIKIEDLASMCNLSTNYFSKLFKQHTAYSPKEYIIRVRIERAKVLLSQSSLSVSEICEHVGFSDIHYFSFCFKKFEGLSPSQYRSTVAFL